MGYAGAGVAKVKCDGGFGQVCADVGARLAADADLGGVIIAPKNSMFRTKRTVAVIQIIRLVRNGDVHGAAVAGTAVRRVGCGWTGHASNPISEPQRRQVVL